MIDVAGVAATFGALLRDAGVVIDARHDSRFAAALTASPPATVDDLYWLARVTLVSERVAIEPFDRVFAAVFRGHGDVADVLRNPDVPAMPPAVRTNPSDGGVPPAPGGASSPSPGRVGGVGPAGEDGRAGDDAVLAVAPDERELLRHRSFDACTDDELAVLGRTIARMRLEPPLRPSRRTHRHPHGSSIDWRATLRAAPRTGGDPAAPVLRRRGERPRRLVLLADVSGSMERYARAYLHLLHGAVRAVRAETFLFATRLTRVTRVLAGADPAVAMAAAVADAPDWAGGTRLGDALADFNDRWGRRGMARGAVVVIVSDGWDAGDPAVVAREMRRLALMAHRIVWVNPRVQSPRFEPRAGGMAAALPFVDTLVSGHSLAALDDVVAAISETQPAA